MNYRKINASDDKIIAEIIRKNLEKHHSDIPGTAYFDSELDHLSVFYNSNPSKRIYFVAIDENEEVIGGVGIAEFEGIENCAELQKLYLSDSVKGRGYGKELMKIAESWARTAGYKKLYLETHTNLFVAMNLYKKMGFTQIEKPRTTVHSTMNSFYLKEL